ncbi:homing endonuclease associated repeat-containing protein [Bacillus sp. m3-13]|uniref:homing endonuclease associated repeat-containing protein n=1 Tax=Bacillus sp. m3-13 TaxID=406124 RepID=UPI0001E89DA3|nr:hypothetical protein [Bacillus sp. m3-13]
MLTNKQKQIKTKLSNYYIENGVMPTIQMLRSNPDLPSDSVILRAFGSTSYPRVIESMGFPSNKSAVYTKEEVLKYMNEFVNEFGEEKLTHQNFEDWMFNNGRSTSFRKRYGWNKLKKEFKFSLLKETGYDPKDVYDRLIEFVRDYELKNGYYPIINEINKALSPLHISTIEKLNGKKYREILEENEIYIPAYTYTNDYLLEALHKEREETGATPLFESFRKRKNQTATFKDGSQKPACGCFIRAFGSFREALSQAGYEPNLRGDGHCYLSNHNHRNPSRLQGMVDDLLQFVPHEEEDHGLLYQKIPGFEHYKGGKDADIVLLNTPELDKNYIIEVTSYLTREQFEGKQHISPNGRQMQYYKNLHEKLEMVKSSNFKGEFIIIFKDDDIEEHLKPILSKFARPTKVGKIIKKRPVNRERNPQLYTDRELLENLRKRAKEVASKKNGRPPYLKDMVQPERGWAHPSRYFQRFEVKTWDGVLSYAGLENHRQYRDRILFSTFKKIEDSMGRIPVYSEIDNGLYRKALYRFGTWKAFLQKYELFKNDKE